MKLTKETLHILAFVHEVYREIGGGHLANNVRAVLTLATIVCHSADRIADVLDKTKEED